jgi:hypothetical protein
VKAELSKLPSAPGAYRDKIEMDNEPMNIDNQGAGRYTLADRFSRI